jgi:transposase
MGSIKIQAALEEVERQLRDAKDIPPALAAAIQVLMVVIPLLLGRLGLNSHNSSKPPSQDPHRSRKTDGGSGKARGGQPGRAGTTLRPVDDPDAIEIIHIDKRSLPRSAYQVAGFERRQVIDIRIERHVTEYRAEILANVQGKRFVAPFPQGVTRPVQYGASVKAQAVYLSMFQLIPYARIETHFAELYALPISAGSLVNFNQEACERLDTFVRLAKLQLRTLRVMHADETGVNVDGKLRWLHTASSERWTLFAVHAKRGREAMDEIGVLPAFTGTLVHAHWKPYYLYSCVHALCNGP